MGKTTYFICAINMVASALALFLIFRSPAKPGVKNAVELRPAVKPTEAPVSPEEGWDQFTQASAVGAAASHLAKLPSGTDTLGKVASYLQANEPPETGPVDFARIARVGACVHYLGAHATKDGPHRQLLQAIAQNPQESVAVRDLAIRAVVDSTLRHKTADGGNETGRAELGEFLQSPRFGAETSLAGLALQATVFAQNQGIATIDMDRLAARVNNLLEQHANVEESTLIAALEMCGQYTELRFLERVRRVASQPRSAAVLQTAVATLGKIGEPEDRVWLAQLKPASPALHRAIEASATALGAKTAGAP